MPEVRIYSSYVDHVGKLLKGKMPDSCVTCGKKETKLRHATCVSHTGVKRLLLKAFLGTLSDAGGGTINYRKSHSLYLPLCKEHSGFFKRSKLFIFDMKTNEYCIPLASTEFANEVIIPEDIIMPSDMSEELEKMFLLCRKHFHEGTLSLADYEKHSKEILRTYEESKLSSNDENKQ